MTGTIDRIRDATIRASNFAELRAFYNRIRFDEVLARGDEFVVFAACPTCTPIGPHRTLRSAMPLFYSGPARGSAK